MDIEPQVRRCNDRIDFDALLRPQLKCYVYVLRDPRDGQVFYVGKAGGSGEGNRRVLDHFDEAEKLLAVHTTTLHGSKHLRIIDIWRAGRAVEWAIARWGLGPEEARHVEAALIDVMQSLPGQSVGGGALTNMKREWTSLGWLTPRDVADMAARAVAPQSNYSMVFVFPIPKSLKRTPPPSLYEITREAWTVGLEFRNATAALAVGIADDIARAVFEIHHWELAKSMPGKRAFVGAELPGHEFVDKNFAAVISPAKGYWMRPGYLVVEFRPGEFRYLRGHRDRQTWRALA